MTSGGLLRIQTVTYNAAQVRQILAGMPAAPVIAAGDLNAVPGTEPLRLWEASGRFAGVFDGAPSFPSSRPNRRLDTVLLPIEWLDRCEATWKDEVLDVDLSDHEPVVVRVTLALDR
jgi:endonuclease/exonuclease/phosphatase family metal-dependent hydrolase